jgi:hypothetical protein
MSSGASYAPPFVSYKPLSGKTEAVTRTLCRQARFNIIDKQ